MIETKLNIDSAKTILNNSSGELNQLYCLIENDDTKENIINLYSNTTYTISVNESEIEQIGTVKYGKYYFMVFENYVSNLDTTTKSGITYTYGSKKIVIANDIIKTNLNFKLNDIDKNYTWCIYKFNTSTKIYEIFTSGKIVVNYPLIYIKLTVGDNKLINDENNEDYINIDINQNITSNNLNIVLYEKYNYVFELIYNSITTYKLDIYVDSIVNYNRLNINGTKLSKLYIENLPNIKKHKFVWGIKNNLGTVLNSGNIIFVNLGKIGGNDENVNDFKFKNISINRLYYNKFIYNEKKNIVHLNNNINHLLPKYSNKLLLISNTNTNISIILPSTDIYLGINYKILFNIDINTLNISFEDSSETLTNYDKIKGGLFIVNKNNVFCKTANSNIELFENGTVETDLSQNIIIKQMNLNNGKTYNGGLYKYGLLNIVCVEYKNNKYIWNITGELIGNSLEYNNTYLYNPFI